MIRLSKRGLCILDLSLWVFAGLKVVLTGYTAALEASAPVGEELRLGTPLVVLAVTTLFVFRYLILRPAMRKNLDYIRSQEGERHPFYKCMRPSGWVIIACMMTLGITLRYSGLVPLEYIASFYSGLGFALASTGLSYLPWITGKQTLGPAGSPSRPQRQTKQKRRR